MLHLLSWDMITIEKNDGGLGIKDLGKQNEAFIMKLCWNLLNDTEALWVHMLRAKYKCGHSPMPKVNKRKNSSLTWRSICSLWDKFQRGVGAKIGNGYTASFWRDNLSEVNRPLMELIRGHVSFADRYETMSEFVTPWGEWNGEKLGRWFQPHIVDCIVCAHPPHEERGERRG